jgi:DNA polymerase
MAKNSEIEIAWKKIVDEIIKCRKCDLHSMRRNAVPGEGNLRAEIMFIGEAPGLKEDEMGRPFVGAAGNLLTKLIEEIGLKREDVFIANVLKCRPPNNRDPTEHEMNMCLPYLVRQIELIKPRIIVSLGRYSGIIISRLAGIPFKGITRERGIPRKINLFTNQIIFLPTYHPAAALYKPPLLNSIKQDFETLKSLLSNKEKFDDTLDKYLY